MANPAPANINRCAATAVAGDDVATAADAQLLPTRPDVTYVRGNTELGRWPRRPPIRGL